VDELEGAFTWILGGGIVLAAAALCLLLGALLRAALGGGIDRLEPMPPGFMRHAAEVAARIRAHHRARREDAAWRGLTPAI
jgi:hypothetical protein